MWLRQISVVAAGHGNNNTVHFGDDAGLLRAILARRPPKFELLSKVEAQGRLGASRP